MSAMLYSLARYIARLVPAPRLPERRRINTSSADRLGFCPVCQAFICLGPAGLDGLAPCPRCSRSIGSVEPLA